ncbi:MAG: HAMP domain-containing protein [Alphaproteobacteria bacterium]|nr:HAMP domain-containing protein [Alphaproteobacteria bacterium]
MKRFLPKTLFARTILIVITPIIFVMVGTAYLFLDRHLDSVTRQLANSISSEAVMSASVLETATEEDIPRIIQDLQRIFFLQVMFHPSHKLVGKKTIFQHAWVDKTLGEALNNQMHLPYNLATDGQNIYIGVQLPKGVMALTFNHKRLLSRTTPLVLLWVFGSSLILFILSLIFLRNQVRPIRRLALAVEKFGKGQEVPYFKPSGALEVRRTAKAFSVMRNRINRQLQQRTDMLAGISHDLRTPLTRMKLELEMLPESLQIHSLKKDLNEMEYMLEGYLAFVRGEGVEAAAEVDLRKLLMEVVKDAERKKATIHFTSDALGTIIGRPHALKRCVTNFVSNANRYAKSVYMTVRRSQDRVEILVDDDGPGIPPEKRKEVFKPFHRLEESRNVETGGVVLGMSIALDIVHAHGGKVSLDESPQGGLRVHITLPL